MFKKGDKVRCIDDSFRNLTKGDLYDVEVSERVGSNDDTFIQVKNDNGNLEEFWASRFELVEEEKKMYKEEDIYAGMKLECVSNGSYTNWTEGKVYVVNDNLQIYSDMDSSREVPTILQYLNEVDNGSVMFKVVEKKRYTLDDLKEGMVLRCTDSRGYEFWTTGKEYTLYKDGKGLYVTDDWGNNSRDTNLLNRLNDKGSNARMEIVSTPESTEPEEITLAITGSNYQELLDQACELKRLLTVHVVNSELADSALVTIKEVFGGTK